MKYLTHLVKKLKTIIKGKCMKLKTDLLNTKEGRTDALRKNF